MTTIVLVRHGQASFGAANYDRLSPLGERQADILGLHWQAGGFVTEHAFSGSMQRQRVTGERALAASGHAAVPLSTDRAFNEFNHTQLISAYLPLVARENPDLAIDAQTLLSDPAKFRPMFNLIVSAWIEGREPLSPIDETWSAFSQRCVDGVRRAAEQAERIVAFTSGGVIMAVLREALGVEPKTALRMNWRIWNASVHEFHLQPQGLTLAGFNDVSHLKLQRDASIITRI